MWDMTHVPLCARSHSCHELHTLSTVFAIAMASHRRIEALTRHLTSASAEEGDQPTQGEATVHDVQPQELYEFITRQAHAGREMLLAAVAASPARSSVQGQPQTAPAYYGLPQGTLLLQCATCTRAKLNLTRCSGRPVQGELLPEPARLQGNHTAAAEEILRAAIFQHRRLHARCALSARSQHCLCTLPRCPARRAVPADPLKFQAGLECLALCDYSLSIKAGVHFTLCGGAIAKLGTQKHFDALFERLDTLDLPGCFGMTELGHGSNVMGLETQVRAQSSLPCAGLLQASKPSAH